MRILRELSRLRGFPAIGLVEKWGMDEGIFQETEMGTPQGGIISPLLLNVALHGMEEAVGVYYQKSGKYTQLRSNVALIRYADDFVIFATTKEEAETSKDQIGEWLKDRGPENFGRKDRHPTSARGL